MATILVGGAVIAVALASIGTAITATTAGLGVATEATGIGLFGFIVFLLWPVWVLGISFSCTGRRQPRE